jgi:hypothetical protein
MYTANRRQLQARIPEQDAIFKGEIGKKELRFRGWFDIISTQAGI